MLARMVEPLPLLPASFPLGKAWFIASVEGRMETRARDEIVRLGFTVFCPMERRFRVVRGRKTEVVTPVFQGYLFVSFDRERDDWGLIQGARGVFDILKHEKFGMPAPVQQREIDMLMNADAAGVFDKANAFQQGETVEITDPRFLGLLGKVKSAEPRKRMKILLDGLGTLEIEPYFLRRA